MNRGFVSGKTFTNLGSYMLHYLIKLQVYCQVRVDWNMESQPFDTT